MYIPKLSGVGRRRATAIESVLVVRWRGDGGIFANRYIANNQPTIIARLSRDRDRSAAPILAPDGG